MESGRSRPQGKKGPQFFAAMAACMGAFGLGTVLGWSSPANPQLHEDPDWGNRNASTTWEPESWIGSLVNLGALASGPVTGFCIEALGRKTTMLILSAPFVLGWLLITYASGVGMLLVGRVITGFCGGAFSLAAPVYIGETAEDSVRGTLGAGFQVMLTIGILFTYVVGVGVTWEWLSLICGFGPLIFLVMMIFPPESPRWLISKGKHAEAIEALRWLRGASSSQDVEDELNEIQKGVDEGKMMSASFSDLLKPPVLKPTLICLGLMFFQQLSGVNAVIFYTKDIFVDAGSTLNPDIAVIIVGIVQVGATMASSVLMDRLGRKILLLFSAIVMCASLVVLGVFFYIKDSEPEKAESIGWLPLICLMLFIVAFSLGFGPVPWLMTGELIPPHVKGLASAIATSLNWTLAFIVTRFFEDLNKSIGADWCYWLFAIVCALGTAFVFLFAVETKGKSLDEIQMIFGGDSAAATTSSSSEPQRNLDKPTSNLS